MYAEDARDMVTRLIQDARDKNIELPIEDGFDLYKGLAAIRRLYADALPGYYPRKVYSLNRTDLSQTTISVQYRNVACRFRVAVDSPY